MTNLLSLGTVLMVWAHPDDETYLVGGLSAALTDAGQRVVCVMSGGNLDVGVLHRILGTDAVRV